ncbi:uncharacterized protein [Antedon mediterranea]|uniref:uncharacterized protein n=1 Tax=Antedon mediterranea TaxID=105859 RepID=UPI003AF6F550
MWWCMKPVIMSDKNNENCFEDDEINEEDSVSEKEENEAEESNEEKDSDEEKDDDDVEKNSDEEKDSDEENDISDEEDNLFKKEILSASLKRRQNKKENPGIVYLSRIPMFMRPNRLKLIFSEYGQLGRIYLQPEEKYKKDHRKKKTGSRAKIFTEGWIEFKNKKIAKRVASTFNNTKIGGKKTSRQYDDIWNMKYLSRFQWSHLVERLEYENAVRDQRMRTEISQVKKETNFFIKNIEKKKVLEKLEDRKRKKGEEWTSKMRSFKQRKTDEKHSLSKALNEHKKKAVSSDFLHKIFQA